MKGSNAQNLYLLKKMAFFNEVWHHMDHVKNICNVNDNEVGLQT